MLIFSLQTVQNHQVLIPKTYLLRVVLFSVYTSFVKRHLHRIRSSPTRSSSTLSRFCDKLFLPFAPNCILLNVLKVSKRIVTRLGIFCAWLQCTVCAMDRREYLAPFLISVYCWEDVPDVKLIWRWLGQFFASHTARGSTSARGSRKNYDVLSRNDIEACLKLFRL